MPKLKKILLTLSLVLIVATTWVPLAQLSRMDSSLYLPNGFRLIVAALGLLFLKFLFQRDWPHISLSTLNAAASISVIAYFVPVLMTYYMIRTLPSGVFPLAFTFVPLWLILFWPIANWSRGIFYVLFCLLQIGGFALFISGLRPGEPFSNSEITLFVLLVLSMGTFAVSLAVARKVSWIHANEDLNFWALLVAGLLFCLLGFLSGESPVEWSETFIFSLAGSGALSVALGIYLYRSMAIESNTVVLFCLWMGTVVIAELLSFFVLKDTPVSLRTLLGSGLCLIPFTSGLGRERIHIWASHFISNTRRQGDRVSCHLDGFMKGGAASTIIKIHVHDLSIGGLGFDSEASAAIGEDMVVSLPFPSVEWSQVSFECKVVHISKSKNPQWAFSGGLSFKKLAPAQRQMLVEFLAKIGPTS